MSSSTKKRTPFLESDQTEEGSITFAGTDSRLIRKVSPLGMRVVVQMRKEENLSEGGLYLPEGAKEKLDEAVLARVIEVASAIDDRTHEEANISGIPNGATVLLPKNAGVRVPWDPDVRVVETKDILALVNEMDIV